MLLNKKIKMNNGDIVRGNKGIDEQRSYFGLNVDNLNKYGDNIPGFQALKNNILKPIIVATEKYVEYYQTSTSSNNAPS
jgi:hypothetical protein